MTTQEYNTYMTNMGYSQPIYDIFGTVIDRNVCGRIVALRELQEDDLSNILESLTFYYDYFLTTQKYFSEQKKQDQE